MQPQDKAGDVPGIRVPLPNGEFVEATIQVWLAALLKTLPSEQLLKVIAHADELRKSLVIVKPKDQTIYVEGIKKGEMFGRF